MKAYFLFILFLIPCLLGCNKEKSDAPEFTDKSFSDSQVQILEQSNDFGINLFRDLGDDFPESKNLFISPYSVYLALTMAYNGAASETATEMKNTLGFSGMTQQQINETCKTLTELLVSIDPNIILEIANSIWYRNDFSVKPDFLSVNQDYFNAEVHSCNFNEPATVNLINNWVSTNTHNKIEKIIDNIDQMSVMFLINAIYFKGTWRYQFDKTKTQTGAFMLNDNSTVQVDYMRQKATFNYLQNDLFSAIELPYGNSRFSMMILLPSETKNVSNIIGEFTHDNWINWCTAMDSTEVTITIPKFKFTYDSVINESLKNLGIKKAFGPHADFSNINDEMALYISSVLHKSFVEVNEEGTEAAAVTVIDIRFTSIGEEKFFTVNRPFVFVIKENFTKTILFSGILNNPTLD